MANVTSRLRDIVQRIRSVWGEESVEMSNNSSSSWLYRIKFPDDGSRIQLHATPSDPNWEKNFWLQMNNHGFDEDEKAKEHEKNIARLRTIAEDRVANEKRTKLVHQKSLAYDANRAAGIYVAQPVDRNWALSLHEFPESRRVLIEPDFAEEVLLNHNEYNRRLIQSRVEIWKQIALAGHWTYTHQGIAIDTRSQLQDGQHRLKMSVELDFPLDIQLTVGMPVENFTKIDTGAARSGVDVAYLAGKDSHANTFAGAARLIKLYYTLGPELRSNRRRLPNDILVNAITEYGNGLDVAVTTAHTLKRRSSCPAISPIVLTATYYLIDLADPTDRFKTTFLEGFVSGVSLVEGDPRNALRTYMSNMRSGRSKSDVPTQFGITIKAWNDYVRGNRRDTLKINSSEAFPKVVEAR